ncbi:hypothetical protein [Flavobacterium sp.]|uniref:hypothetical protein n=1 Tax=Flavobacterium sp. TaxID=239 RepID=UPI00286E5709|nr:hypothetical protein [Flavobacterium sp.]
MKKITTLFFIVLGITIGSAQENDNPEFTGENFSLEGALALFKKANSLEEFEKMINQEDNNVNNLDLNDDGNIDYINVDAIKESNTHVIVLSTFLNENEKQDIATIGIEKTGNEEATLQMEGDEELYATNTIAEPFDSSDKIEKTKGGPALGEITTTSRLVNVWFWPCVRFVYAPNYVIWTSPYRFGFHPRWWKPWRPFRYSFFYSRSAPHRVYYHRTPNRRLVFVKKIYIPKRRYSKIVVHHNKHSTVVVKSNNRKVKDVKTPKKSNVKVVKHSKRGRR